MNIKEIIVKSISNLSGVKKESIHLESPENMEFGDYFTNVALILSKERKVNPRELAMEIVTGLAKIRDLNEMVSDIKVEGPGFINFFLKKEVLIDTLLNISSHKDTVRYSDTNKGRIVIIEFSSPNIAKPFTIGHLRSTIIGSAIANLMEATGFKVMKDNHLGDWGTQFGKQIYAIKAWGNINDIEKSQNPVKELVALYVKFHEEAEKDDSLNDKAREWFKKLENKDPEARNLWSKCVELSWKEFDKIYQKLGVTFSKEFNNGRGLGESFFEDKMGPVIKELEDKKLLEEGEEGAKLIFFENDKYSPAMILKKDGATLYHTRDLATDKFRKENYNPDLIINEVGLEQSLYFQQLFEIEKLLGWFKEGQRKHIAHGLYRFKDRKMSTRKGDVIWLEDILVHARGIAKNIRNRNKATPDLEDTSLEASTIPFEDVDDDVSIGALKYNDLKRDPKGDIHFDWNEILNMEGNSGPYLQYTYARCQSVLAKADNFEKLKINNSSEINSEESSLLRTFIHFQEVVEEAAFKYSPNLLCNYLYDLAQKYNGFYNKHKIIAGDNEALRLAITESTGILLKAGLNLLGIQAPEKM